MIMYDMKRLQTIAKDAWQGKLAEVGLADAVVAVVLDVERQKAEQKVLETRG